MTEFTNHLAHEKSPYLQQHAHNPVDWYPWGQEAFQKARELEKPIFLSIGYATCHWCHVMERESFADVEIGKLLNDSFVNIKVDREEHPEIDSLYMSFASALIPGGGGGWPLNVLLTPDLKPFLAVTYLPAKPMRGMISLPELVSQVKQLWNGPERKELEAQAQRLVETFAQTSNATGAELPNEDSITIAIDRFFEITDPIHGGLRGEPKFPLGFQSEFLLGLAKLKADSRSLFYVQLTLDMMSRGGIYDHLGGGFSRYAVDEEWTIPHFEKMLYDNAILAKTYTEAWKYTKNPIYEKIAKETVDYLIRDLMHEQGGFFSGEDADTQGHEGLFYTWTVDEVKEILTEDEAELMCAFYDITPAGNFEGRNVLHMDLTLEEFSQAIQMNPKDVEKLLEKSRKALLKKRSSRPRPLRDEKIITSWNGLIIDALARASSAFQEPKYMEYAEKAAQFIHKNLWQGHLLHRWCAGEAKFSGLLDDYAFLIKGLLSLFEEGRGTHYLEWATELTKILEKDFKEMEGAFYLTDDKTDIILRQCEFYDGAEPSGNAVHTENLLRLYQITQKETYLRQAEDILKAAKNYIENFSPAAFYHMMALLRYLDLSSPNVTIITGKKGVKKEDIQKILGSHFSSHLVTVWDFPEDKPSIHDQTTVYICRQNQCESPLTKLEEIVKAVENL